MKRDFVIGAFCLSAALQPLAARAQVLQPLTDIAMSDARAGFVTAGGLTFGLGVQITTYVDGSLALLSTMTYTGPNVTAPTTPATLDVAAVTIRPGSGATVPAPTSTENAVTPVAQLGTAATPPAIVNVPAQVGPPPTAASVAPPPGTTTAAPAPAVSPATPAPQPTTATATPISPSMPVGLASPGPSVATPTVTPGAPASSVQGGGANTGSPPGVGGATTAVSDDGKTVVIHDLNPAQLTNIVVNSADGRTIKQDIDVNIVLPGFDAIQQTQLLSSIGLKINRDSGLAFVGSLSH